MSQNTESKLLTVHPKHSTLEKSDFLLLKKECNQNIPQTFKVPRSKVVDRLQAFLPKIAAENKKLNNALATAPPGKYDIEHIDSETERVIEMNLDLFRRDEANDSETSDDSSNSESECDCEEFNCTCTKHPLFGQITAEQLRLPGQPSIQKKPEIEELNSNQRQNTSHGQTESDYTG